MTNYISNDAIIENLSNKIWRKIKNKILDGSMQFEVKLKNFSAILDRKEYITKYINNHQLKNSGLMITLITKSDSYVGQRIKSVIKLCLN